MAEFGDMFNDMRYGLKVARKNVVSFVLAVIGLAIVLALVTMTAMAAVILATWGTWPLPWYMWGNLMGPTWMMQNIVWLYPLGITVLTLFSTLVIALIGGLFGLMREAVIKGSTHAEIALSYLRHRGSTLLGAGFILTIVIVLPQVLVWSMVTLAMGSTVPTTSAILAVFSYLWSFLTLGLMSMVLPSAVRGTGLCEAVRESIKIARSRPERVYGLWSVVVVGLILSYLPACLLSDQLWWTGMHMMWVNSLAVVVGVWTIVVSLFWLLLGIPAVFAGLTRVYVEEVEQGTTVDPDESTIPLV